MKLALYVGAAVLTAALPGLFPAARRPLSQPPLTRHAQALWVDESAKTRSEWSGHPSRVVHITVRSKVTGWVTDTG